MKEKMLGIVASCILLGASGTAAATVVDFGTIGPGDSMGSSLFYSESGVAIADTWTFAIEQTLLVAIAIDANDLVPFFEIADLLAVGDSLTFEYNAVDNQYTFVGNLAAGSYSFDISGLTTGMLGGQYEVSVGGLAIPLPAGLWLLGAAMLTLCSTRRRKEVA